MSEPAEKDARTEEATPRRLDQMRKDGRAPKSPDVSSAAVLLAAVAAAAGLGGSAAHEIAMLTRRALRFEHLSDPVAGVRGLGAALGQTLVPITVLFALAAVVAGVVQTQGLFALSQAAPKWSRLDPLEGSKRLLPGPETLTELGKMLLKVGILGAIAWTELRDAAPRLSALSNAPAEVGAVEIGQLASAVVLKVAGAFVAIAAFDYFLAWRRFREEARMTKQEIKDEHKSEEGDPQMKAKRRQRARAMMRQRSVAEVKNATVLVVNPTHVAVALRYEPGRDAAPIVIAKGVDETALRMREAARGAGVPIVENRPLARAMHEHAKVGRPIPIELYEAAARVIAHVLHLRGRARSLT